MSSKENTGSENGRENDRRKVVLKARAEKEFERILGYLVEQRPSAADAFRKKFAESCALLAHLPLIGRVARSVRLLRKGYRSLVVGDHVLFYKVNHGTVEIYQIVHAAKNVDSPLPPRQSASPGLRKSRKPAEPDR